MILLEIKSFQGIEEENIFVRYKMETPTGWLMIGQKSGTTQTCYTGNQGTAHYSMPLEILLESTESLSNYLFQNIEIL